ncbi:hypothetical protein MGN70_012847 [Eutypa lata]|nr:hypothetical protein MGN70_012847 [Eutypa lata]
MAMRTNSNRLAAIASALFITLILFYTTEPRRRSFSCKTFESCLAGRPHAYTHPLPVEPAIYEDERTLRDGTLHFTRGIGKGGDGGGSGRDHGAGPALLILVLNKDEESWSRDFRSTDRSIYDFLDLLVATGLDLATVSLGLMTSSLDEYADIKKATATLPFARADVFYRRPDDSGNGGAASFPYEQRHDPAVQRQRRGALAALRNYLMLRSLRDEDHVVWIDADVVDFSEGIVQAMVAHANRRDDVGMITAACHQNDMENYDKNAWTVDRNASSILDAVREDDREKAVQTLDDTRAFTDVIANGTADGELLPLDSVGGTILYMRADLVRQGVIFPTFNVVGTTWSRDGWIGVETEGICYVASSVKGGGCFLLGGNHHVRHADLG